MCAFLRPLPLAIVLLVAPAFAATPDDYETLLEEAIDAIASHDGGEWAFTEASIEGDSETVARFDPRRPAGRRWQLLSIDGRVPTEDEIEEFSADKADEDDPDGDDEHDVEDMVEADSLDLVADTAQYWLFSFVPSEDDEENEGFAALMSGTLKIMKDGRYLASVDIHNEKPFKPKIGVKVNEILTRLTFAPAVEDGPVVIKTVDVAVDIRVFLVINIDEIVSITFSDFEHVGD